MRCGRRSGLLFRSLDGVIRPSPLQTYSIGDSTAQDQDWHSYCYKPKTRYARFRLDWPALRAGPARAYWPALRAGQARATRGPITQLSANKPSDFYNIDAPSYARGQANKAILRDLSVRPSRF